MFQRVAIIGMGLIGGSIGLTLLRKRAAEVVAGYDLGEGVCERAYRIGAINRYYETLSDTVRGAELVVLATPVGAIQRLLRDIVPYLRSGTVVTDVASTKVQVLAWAEAILPEYVSFIGGHPMAGREVSGVEAADAALFYDRIYCLTPTPHTPPNAVSIACSLIEVLGAHILFLNADEHDKHVAAVSHLPFLTSVALVQTVTGDSVWKNASLLAAGGFRDTSRLAAGNPAMYRDICLTNSAAIVDWLDKYIATLQMLRECVAERDEGIEKIFQHAHEKRVKWQNERVIADGE
jgi:prephenate dehydrogenase